MTRERKPFPERFWAKVDKRGPDECWPWKASRRPNGYGQINYDRRCHSILAHRASWELHNGPIPDGLHVMHSCDNPPCVNPAHLVVGTPSENIQDMLAKGRCRPARGSASGRAKLTEEDVRGVIAMGQAGVRPCDIERQCGMSRATVSRILNRKTWRHIYGT